VIAFVLIGGVKVPLRAEEVDVGRVELVEGVRSIDALLLLLLLILSGGTVVGEGVSVKSPVTLCIVGKSSS
jgi:hypothetical protein